MTWRSAAESLSLHAAHRADELLADGDVEGRRSWQRIAETELQRSEPGEGTPTH